MTHAIHSTPEQVASIEAHKARLGRERRNMDRAIALGGTERRYNSSTHRVYFDVERALLLAGVRFAEWDAAKAEIKSVYYEPSWGWMVMGRRHGTYREAVESALIERHTFSPAIVCNRCGDTGVIDHDDGCGEYESHSYCECAAGDDARERDAAEHARINAEEAAVALSWAAPGPIADHTADDLLAPPF